MNNEEIEVEFNKFFEFDTTDHSSVTSTSAKLFARHIADMAVAKEREACALECDAIEDRHWQAYKHGIGTVKGE